MYKHMQHALHTQTHAQSTLSTNHPIQLVVLSHTQHTHDRLLLQQLLTVNPAPLKQQCYMNQIISLQRVCEGDCKNSKVNRLNGNQVISNHVLCANKVYHLDGQDFWLITIKYMKPVTGIVRKPVLHLPLGTTIWLGFLF